MYLLAIHIPVYEEGGRFYTDLSWQRDVLLARDWLARPFGGLIVLAPCLPLDAANDQTVHLARIGFDDGIRVAPSFDPRCRAWQFRIKRRTQWVRDVRRALADAKVIHTTAVDDIYCPLGFLAHAAGVKSRAATVLVGPDMDPHVTRPAERKARLESVVFDLMMHRAVRRADLVLLKEGLVYDRYARRCKNVKAFCHSMHRDEDVIGEADLERRLHTLNPNRPLRAVYAGRFVARKGLRDAIKAVVEARQKGTIIEYDMFGSGPEEGALRRQARDLGVDDRVRFHGFVEYSSQFVATLAEYDLLLFMPTEEDTPRMLYDALAAGLPLLGSRIPFLRHRVEADHMGVLVDIGDSAAAAEHLHVFSETPGRLAELARAARFAGRKHSIQQWYQRRAEWTQEAVEKHLTELDRHDRFFSFAPDEKRIPKEARKN